MSLKVRLKAVLKSIKIIIENKSHTRYFTNEKIGLIKTKLNKSQLKQIKRFYKPYATKINPLFHTFYTEKRGEFDVRYIPDDLWFTKIDRHFNNREKARVLDHKSYYERMFIGQNVKHPETIIHRINGLWYDFEMNLISREKAKEIVAKEKSLFVKVSTGSCGGRGVTHISDKEDIVSQFEKCTNHKSDIVVQREIKQHPELYKVGQNSVNSLRIVSLLTKEGVTVYSCILRMGIGDSKVDNASSGGIICGIKENGALKDIAWTMYGETFERHPTTNIRFSEIKIPSFDKVINTVKELHPMIPDFRLVSWDIVVDEKEEPVLLEVNLCLGGLDLHQLPNGPMFKEDTEQILKEVFGEKKKGVNI